MPMCCITIRSGWGIYGVEERHGKGPRGGRSIGKYHDECDIDKGDLSGLEKECGLTRRYAQKGESDRRLYYSTRTCAIVQDI